MLEADRGHTGIGGWDLMLTDDNRLEIMAELVATEPHSYVHFSTFLVTEVDGERAAVVASHVPGATTIDLFYEACARVLGPRGWDTERIERAHASANSGAYFKIAIPPDTVRIEWVYTDPRFRSRGLSRALIGQHLEQAYRDGRKHAHVGTYIGNEPAIATYRRAGFEVFAEGRHADYEARVGAPGVVFLRRTLA